MKSIYSWQRCTFLMHLTCVLHLTDLITQVINDQEITAHYHVQQQKSSKTIAKIQTLLQHLHHILQLVKIKNTTGNVHLMLLCSAFAKPLLQQKCNTYYKLGVCFCILILVIWHANCIFSSCIILSSVASLALPYFPHYLTVADFQEKVIIYKTCVLIFSTTFL